MLLLQRYDAIYRAVNERFDIRDKTLAHLVISALHAGGRLSSNLRKRYENEVPAAAFNVLDKEVRKALRDRRPATVQPVRHGRGTR